MRKLIASLSLLSLLLPNVAGAYMTVTDYEARTGLYDSWQRDRTDVLARIRAAQTNQNTGETNERAYNVNVVEVEKWTAAYECQTRIAIDRCLVRAEF
jgi:hypothetical protein